MPINIKSVGRKSSTAGKILKLAFATEGSWHSENIINLTLSTPAISRLPSSLCMNILPNQITFDFLSTCFRCFSLYCNAETLLLTLDSLLGNATKDATWLVRKDTSLRALGQIHILLQQTTWGQLCDTAQQYSGSYMGLASYLNNCRDNGLEKQPSQTSLLLLLELPCPCHH